MLTFNPWPDCLAFCSYNIILHLGCKLLHLTPSRGFAAELAAGLTISLASFYGERSQGQAAMTNCRG